MLQIPVPDLTQLNDFVLELLKPHHHQVSASPPRKIKQNGYNYTHWPLELRLKVWINPNSAIVLSFKSFPKKSNFLHRLDALSTNILTF